jgi:hypothetical protein
MQWRQQSKELWLKHGDRNTKCFHASATQWRQRNSTMQITDKEGRLWEREEDMGTTFQIFFNRLFKSDGVEQMKSALQGLEGRISEEMNETLLQDFSKKEVRAALFQMVPLKAPGPNRFSAVFFEDN